MAEVGIVVVTYYSAQVIADCLDAARRTGADVVVVDNASADDTVDLAQRAGVRVLANSKNVGFAAAVNQGIAVLNCPYVLILNPDAVIQGGIDALREACDLPQAGGAGGCLLGVDGKPQTGFMVRNLPTPGALIMEALLLNRIWPNNPVNRRYRCLGLNASARAEVEQPAGAFLMVRREVWQKLGGFDERYWPLWFEEVDFCRRAVDHGFRWFYEPGAVAKHTGAHSIPRLSVEMRKFYWYRSLLRYSARHFHPWALRVVCLAVVLGAIPRLISELAAERNLEPVAAFGKVTRLAGRCLFFGWGEEAF